MLEVRFWTDVFEKRGAILDAWRDGRLNSGFLIREMDGLPQGFTPKHLHGFFMAAFSIVTGLRDEWSGALWAAVTGTLTIAIVGLWTARYFSAGTAILAALLCAISRAHVMYSRSQLAEADAIFFMTAAVLLHPAPALPFPPHPPRPHRRPGAVRRAAVRRWPCVRRGDRGQLQVRPDPAARVSLGFRVLPPEPAAGGDPRRRDDRPARPHRVALPYIYMERRRPAGGDPNLFSGVLDPAVPGRAGGRKSGGGDVPAARRHVSILHLSRLALVGRRDGLGPL